MLKIYDFILYEFKRLRNKYYEINELYFSLDEEKKYALNIKSFMDSDVLKPTKIGSYYLKLLNHYLIEVVKLLSLFSQQNFTIKNDEKEKICSSVSFLL